MDYKTIDYELKGKEINIKGTKLLSLKERDIIFNSIKEPKDIKYWEELRTWNKAFLMFKPTISIYSKNFDLLTEQIKGCTLVRLLHKSYEEAINEILYVVEDKKIRETLVKTALESLKLFNAKKEQERGFLPFIMIPEANTNALIWLLIEFLNEKIKEAKEYIKGIEIFLNKFLPLEPYKQFVKEEEEKIKAKIEECRKLIESYTLGRAVETDIYKAIQVKTDEYLQEDERFKILYWDEVEVEVTDEDIEDIKNAGL